MKTFNEGYQAYKQGKSHSDNPYKEETQSAKHYHWCKGYSTAQGEQE